jgi:hypothetical protein
MRSLPSSSCTIEGSTGTPPVSGRFDQSNETGCGLDQDLPPSTEISREIDSFALGSWPGPADLASTV